MASSTGSSPGCRRRRLDGRALALGLIIATTAGAAMPEYARQALAGFNPTAPQGWAYTLTTERDGRQTVERYDPARPPDGQWTLLRHNGSALSAKVIGQYARSRAGGASTAPQATFQKADIDPASVVLVREDAERAVFRCAFRAVATGADKMLGHLSLQLTIRKRQPHVEQFALELTAPYSPVLGVKMRELLVTMSFAPPGADRPALPTGGSSHFLGRIFFFGVEENIRTSYADFVRVD